MSRAVRRAADEQGEEELAELRRDKRRLEMEVEILKQAGRVLRSSNVSPKLVFPLVRELADDNIDVAVAWIGGGRTHGVRSRSPTGCGSSSPMRVHAVQRGDGVARQVTGAGGSLRRC